MTVRDAIRRKARGLGDKVFVTPHIPGDKLQNAIEGMTGSVESPEDVVAVLDTTVWGKCDDGVLFSETAFYYKKLWENAIIVDYSDIGRARTSGVLVKDLVIEDPDGNVIVKIDTTEFNVKVAAEILNDVVTVLPDEEDEEPDGEEDEEESEDEYEEDEDSSDEEEESEDEDDGEEGSSEDEDSENEDEEESEDEDDDEEEEPSEDEDSEERAGSDAALITGGMADEFSDMGGEPIQTTGNDAQLPVPVKKAKRSGASQKTVEDLIKEKAKTFGTSVYLTPEIPEKKLNNAIVGMTNSEVDPDYVVAVLDSTLFGKSDDGLLFTGEAMYYHAQFNDPVCIKFEDVGSSKVRVEKKKDDKGKITKTEFIRIESKDGKVLLDKNALEFKMGEVSAFLNEVVALGKANPDAFKSTKQLLPLSDSDTKIKIPYVKLVCNCAFSDDGEVDSEEYAEIYNLMVRNDFSQEDRVIIRGYVVDSESTQTDDELIGELQENVPDGSYSTLTQSLIKDMVYLNHKKGKELSSWSENEYIVQLAKKLDVSDAQVAVMVQAIKNDEDILNKRKSDTEIEKSMKELLAKAGAVGLPLAAIYFSGSVVGLSAAGITSGFASLGMGGLLGFSGMVTGIGIAVLVGVGAYKGMKMITGQSELENNKQRELMIQNIIKNHQKAINFLVDDVNYISARLIKALENEAGNHDKIEKLKRMLAKVTTASKMTTTGLLDGVKESMIAKLPKELDNDRFIELTEAPTLQKIRPFVYTVYKKKNREGVVAYIIEYNHGADEYEKLYTVLKTVKYFDLSSAMGAKVSGTFKKIFN